MKEARYLAYEDIKPNYMGYGFQGLKMMNCYDATIPSSWEEYLALYDEAKGHQKVGEASPAYLYVPNTPKNIHKRAPDAKLIVILRNPVERAYSSYLHLRRDNAEVLTFEEALDAEAIRIQENSGLLWRYTDLGFYARQLKRYYDIFPDRQIHVVIYDDLIANVQLCMHNIFKFIGVDQNFIPNTDQRKNVSGVPRYRILHAFLNHNPIASLIGRIFPKSTRSRLKQKIQSALLSKPGMSLRSKKVLADSFREDIASLSKIIGRDLSSWLE